jgi:MscS family membrane protein
MEAWNTLIEWINDQKDYQRYLLLALLMFVLFLAGRFLKMIFAKLSNKKYETDKPILSAFLDAIANSSTVLLVMIGVIVILNVLQFSASYNDIVDTIIRVVTTLGIGYFAFQVSEVPIIWFNKLLSREDGKSSKMFVPVFRNVVRLIVISFVLAQIVQIISGKNFTAIVAGLGIGSLAIALAAQDTLKHFIG